MNSRTRTSETLNTSGSMQLINKSVLFQLVLLGQPADGCILWAEEVGKSDAHTPLNWTWRLFAFFIITSYLRFRFFLGIFPNQRIIQFDTSSEICVKQLKSFLMKRVTQYFGKYLLNMNTSTQTLQLIVWHCNWQWLSDCWSTEEREPLFTFFCWQASWNSWLMLA